MATAGTNSFRGRIYDDITQTIGNTPLIRLRRVTQRLSRRGGREAGELQPALVGEGPHRRGDDRRGRGRRQDQQRHGDRRADQRQYRDRTGVHLRGPGLSAGRDDAREHEPGAPPAAQGVRRRDRADPGGRGDARCGPQGRGDGEEHAARLHAPAVQEPRQSRDPSPHDRRGDLARHRRPDRHPGLRRRHRRHHHRLRRGPQGPQAVGPDHRRRAGRLAGHHASCAARSRSGPARTRSRASAPGSSRTS